MSTRKKTVSQDSLFSSAVQAPLAERLRPQALAEVIGQEHLTGAGGVLSRMVEAGKLQSMILWGPPGCGKTTLARLLADESGYELSQVSAVASGVADLKKHFEEARERSRMGTRTALFVDEIHRFNRAQQDVLLPVVEDGTVTLIGATTENPSFELNSAVLSRARVLVLNRLSAEALEKMLQRAERLVAASHEEYRLPLTDDARVALIAMADGDGRYLLSMVEAVLDATASLGGGSTAKRGQLPSTQWLNPEALGTLLQQRPPVYDKAQESHYNLMSALHKSLRGSDVDAALYWFARMLEGGEDPRYITRRLVRFAVEDVGMADPHAHLQALAAAETYERLGSPEGELAIAQSVIYLATAPKSNAQYMAFKAARKAAAAHGSLMPPKHILNAPTGMMKEMGYGAGYAYDHDAPDGFSGQNYFPDEMPRERFYQPVERGFERDIAKRLAYWAKLREKKTHD
ncbi:MAG: replication-associated recombination protein A [Alphaproteobacteria bacterium]|nr:replication-associated recombination protein A [Alphaproteobacteria bacterium]